MKLDIDTKRLKEAHFVQNQDGYFDVELVYFPTQREYTKGYMKYCDTIHSITNLENIKLDELELDIDVEE